MPASLEGAGEEVHKLAEGVYARIVGFESEAVSNAGFVVLDDVVIVFDTHASPEAAAALEAEIRKVAPKRPRFVVNSHFHPDHTHGNQVFAAAGSRSVDVVASAAARRDVLERDLPAANRSLTVASSQIERLRKELAAASAADAPVLRARIAERQRFVERMGALKIVPPAIALDGPAEIGDAHRRVALLQPGRGHTDGDVVLYLKSEKIVFTGDLVSNGAFPAAQDATLLDWTSAIDAVLALDADTFVPGHGPVATRDDVRRFRKYLEDLRALVAPGVARGAGIETVVREVAVPDEYSSFAYSTLFPSNVQKMYFELKARATADQPGKPPEKSKKIP